VRIRCLSLDSSLSGDLESWGGTRDSGFMKVKKLNQMVLGEDFFVGDPMEPPPACPAGFERAKDNPRVLLKTMPKCGDRMIAKKVSKCCSFEYIYCGQDQKCVTRKTCLVCDRVLSVIGG